MNRLVMAVIVFLEIISNAVRLRPPRFLFNLVNKETTLLVPDKNGSFSFTT